MLKVVYLVYQRVAITDFKAINPNRPQSNKIQQGEVKKMR